MTDTKDFHGIMPAKCMLNEREREGKGERKTSKDYSEALRNFDRQLYNSV